MMLSLSVSNLLADALEHNKKTAKALTEGKAQTGLVTLLDGTRTYIPPSFISLSPSYMSRHVRNRERGETPTHAGEALNYRTDL